MDVQVHPSKQDSRGLTSCLSVEGSVEKTFKLYSFERRRRRWGISRQTLLHLSLFPFFFFAVAIIKCTPPPAVDIYSVLTEFWLCSLHLPVCLVNLLLVWEDLEEDERRVQWRFRWKQVFAEACLWSDEVCLNLRSHCMSWRRDRDDEVSHRDL